MPMTFIRPAILISALLLATGAHAAPTPAPVRAEIDALLAKMQASSCQFERNRSWHSAADARAHLLRKLEYIEKGKRAVASTEQFIDAAATKSSVSGTPYRVKCGGAQPVPSADWLNRELKALRALAHK
ncbi:MAG: DUF5329 domain-containing protein [Telluria sp.]